MREFFMVMSGIGGFITLLLVILLAFFATYIVLRWRAPKDEDPDPQLGIKAAINFFQVILLVCTLLGFSLIFTALFAKIGKSSGNDLWKTGLGMLWGSVVLFAGFEAFFRLFTNQAEFPEVRRAFLGMTLVILGVVSVASFLLFWMGLFDKWKGLSFNFPFGLWLIFLPATAGGMLLFRKMYFPPPAAPAGYPPAGGFPGGGGYEQPMAQPQPAPQPQPMGQQAPAPQPGYEQPSYEPPGYGQPGLPGPGGGYGGSTPAPQSPGYGGPSGGAQLPRPGGGYGGGGGGFGQ